jgi:hypothetical protein
MKMNFWLIGFFSLIEFLCVACSSTSLDTSDDFILPENAIPHCPALLLDGRSTR